MPNENNHIGGAYKNLHKNKTYSKHFRQRPSITKLLIIVEWYDKIKKSASRS